MTVPTDPPDPLTAFKTLWGASQPPFTEAVEQPYESKSFSQFSANSNSWSRCVPAGWSMARIGVGKTLLVQHLLPACPTNATSRCCSRIPRLTGTDLLRLLCLELGRTVRLRRADNLTELRQAWQQLDRIWPSWPWTKRKTSAPPPWKKSGS